VPPQIAAEVVVQSFDKPAAHAASRLELQSA